MAERASSREIITRQTEVFRRSRELANGLGCPDPQEVLEILLQPPRFHESLRPGLATHQIPEAARFYRMYVLYYRLPNQPDGDNVCEILAETQGAIYDLQYLVKLPQDIDRKTLQESDSSKDRVPRIVIPIAAAVISNSGSIKDVKDRRVNAIEKITRSKIAPRPYAKASVGFLE